MTAAFVANRQPIASVWKKSVWHIRFVAKVLWSRYMAMRCMCDCLVQRLVVDVRRMGTVRHRRRVAAK